MSLPLGSAASRSPERKIYRVAELTRWIRTVLEESVGSVWIEGEISNLSRPSSGHLYFTLKDAAAQITAVLFRGNQRGLTVPLRDGLLVRIFGDISVYERSGNYQVIVRQVEAGGQGALQEQFEKLKARLLAEGLFATERKRPLPLLPRHVGVVTSPTGAAIRDILNVIRRRFPDLHVVIAPVRVQGVGAAQEIAEGIERLNAWGGVEVIIVGRGGGSLEDLWCFNEEVVARAIAKSAIPIISAVGHEIDFTISDFVADVRAPTPSAAAELVVERKDALVERLNVTSGRLVRATGEGLLRARHRLMTLAAAPGLRDPTHIIREQMQRLDRLSMRLETKVTSGLRLGRERLRDHGGRLGHSVALRLNNARRDTAHYEAQLRTMSPRAVLLRGYSITFDAATGEVIRSAARLKSGDRIRSQFGTGGAESRVENVQAEGKEQT